MKTLRVIYTPDERQYSTPRFKIISGNTAIEALVSLAKMYDFEIPEDLIEDGELLNIIDILHENEDINLSFVQDVDTGEVYADDIFEVIGSVYEVNEAAKKLSVQEALHTLRSNKTLDEAFGDASDDWTEYAESHLPYEARCKEDWMDPENAGTGCMNDGECDIMWVCQGDCDFYDFETLMDCFGKYYKKQTNGKTYVAVMKSRSWPGYGNYIKRIVSFNNGKYSIKEGEPQLLRDGEVELSIYYDGARYFIKKDSEMSYPVLFKLSSHSEDIEGYGETLAEVKEDFKASLEDLNDYTSWTPGYCFSHNEVELDLDKPDTYCASDWLNEYMEKNYPGLEDWTEVVEKLNEKVIDDELEPIAEGEYRTYEKLED